MPRFILAILLAASLSSACATGLAEGPGATTDFSWGTSSDDSARQAAGMQAEQARQQQASDDAWNAQQQALNQQVQDQINLMSQSILQPPTPTFP